MGRLSTPVNLFILLLVLVDASIANPVSSLKISARLSLPNEMVHRSSRHLLQVTSGSGDGTSATTGTTDDLYDITTDTTEEDNISASRQSSRIPPVSTTPRAASGLNQTVRVLVGSLVALSAIIMIFIIVIIILIIVVVKINRRRKIERDLVLRTKQDIFEGVTSGVTQEEMSSINKYNVDVATLESSAKDSEDRDAETGRSPSKGPENQGPANKSVGKGNSKSGGTETGDAGAENFDDDNATSNST